MIKAFWNNADKLPLKFSELRFSGGEIQVRLLDTDAETLRSRDKTFIHITLRAHLTAPDDLVLLPLLVDAIRRVVPDVPLDLICPYLPYARQDRVCVHGEALALSVMADMINRLNFRTVRVWDVHSDVALALLNRVTNVPPQHLMIGIPNLNNCVFVAPDAGALKKVHAVGKFFKQPVVSAEKHRDTDTGEITGTSVHSEHIGHRDFVIVDDICDGGRTFLELAKVLRPLTHGKIQLYVTHGIFSKGLEVFEGVIDGIYTAIPFPNVDLTHPLLAATEGKFV